MTLGEKIKLKRTELDLSKKELAIKVGYLDESVIDKIEKNILGIPSYKIDIFCEALQVPPMYLLDLYNENLNKVNSDSYINIPLYGRASAGVGYINMNDIVGSYSIPYTVYKKDLFAVKVEGDSMTCATNPNSILSGSYAIVNPNDTDILSGRNKIYIVTYRGITFIKQVMIKDETIYLHSFNSEYEDIVIEDLNEVRINGRVIKTFYEKTY